MTDAPHADAAPLDRIDFAKGDGLVVAIAQEVTSHEILMVAFANRAAADQTLRTGYAHFYSRSRDALWKKGETSGNVLPVRAVSIDCDGDALIYHVAFPDGVACHTGARTCFFDTVSVARPGGARDRELVGMVRRLLRAYMHLRETDLESQSGTSRLLRKADDAKLVSRLRDELGELLGVLAGSHTHEGHSQAETLVLECSQVWYWAVAGAVAARVAVDANELVAVLQAAAATISISLSASAAASPSTSLQAACEALPTLSPRERLPGACAIIATACTQLNVDIAAPLEHDLKQMQSKPYLQAVLGV